MNSKDRNIDELLKGAKEALKSQNEEEIFEFEKIKFQIDFMQKVQLLMNDRYKPMSRQELADKLGVSKSMVSQLFSGDKKINIDFIIKIQNIFNKKVILTFEEKRVGNLKTPKPFVKTLNQGSNRRQMSRVSG